MNRPRDAAFTLIETLVPLAVLALSAVAILGAAQSMWHGWAISGPAWPHCGRRRTIWPRSGWACRPRRTDPDLTRLDITATEQGSGRRLARLTGFVPTPAGADPACGDAGPALRQVLWAVTGFTLAHALTLTAAATLYLRPPSDLIGALVALSIVVTAADKLRRFLSGPRAAAAALFGLIRGCGLAAMPTGTVFALHALRGGMVLLWAGSLAGAAAGCWRLWQATG